MPISAKEMLIYRLYLLALREVRRQGYVGIANWPQQERKLRRLSCLELRAMVAEMKEQLVEVTAA